MKLSLQVPRPLHKADISTHTRLNPNNPIAWPPSAKAQYISHRYIDRESEMGQMSGTELTGYPIYRESYLFQESTKYLKEPEEAVWSNLDIFSLLFRMISLICEFFEQIITAR